MAAAIRLSDGRVFSHATHHDAIWVAFDAGAFPAFATTTEEGRDAFAEVLQSGEFFEGRSLEDGFTTSNGRFVGRQEAFQIARSARQVRAEMLRYRTASLDVEDLPLDAN